MDQTPKKKADPLLNLKYMGYRLVQPNKTFDSFVRYAQFQLCAINKVLMKDPIWDTYTREEIVLEYYAHEFNLDKELREKFESEMGDINGKVMDFLAWANKQMAEEEKIRKMTLDQTEEKISFSPEAMGDDT